MGIGPLGPAWWSPADVGNTPPVGVGLEEGVADLVGRDVFVAFTEGIVTTIGCGSFVCLTTTTGAAGGATTTYGALPCDGAYPEAGAGSK